MTPLPINSDLEISKRLLRSFSVETLKELFNLTDSKERQASLLNTILISNPSKIINNKIFDNFSLLKQHVYIYEFKGIFNENWLNSHPSYISTQRLDRNNYIFNLLIPVVFQGFNKTKGIMEDFIFHLPVQIYRKRNILIFYINILERDLAAITTDVIIGASKDLKDIDILDDLVSYAKPVRLIKYDLNKGIKELWKIDEIDALKVKYKNSKSTSQEIMDEDNMIKKEMPALYVSLITKPLNITTFRILKQTNLMHFFNVDPSRGHFTFTVFPKHLNGTNYLIDLVLKNN